MAETAASADWVTQLVAARKEQIQKLTTSGPSARERQQHVISACQALWAMIEQAINDANTALAQLAPDDLLSLQRTENLGRISLGHGPDARAIDLMITPRVVDGTISGGAVITTGRTPASIPLVLIENPSDLSLHWIVQTARVLVTPDVIHTLFLYAFSDDPQASLTVANYWRPAL